MKKSRKVRPTEIILAGKTLPSGMDTYRRVEDKFWPFKEVKVPDCNDAVGVVDCRRVFVIGRDA